MQEFSIQLPCYTPLYSQISHSNTLSLIHKMGMTIVLTFISQGQIWMPVTENLKQWQLKEDSILFFSLPNLGNRHSGFYLVSLLCKASILMFTSQSDMAALAPAIIPSLQPAEGRKRRKRRAHSVPSRTLSISSKPFCLYLISTNLLVLLHLAVGEANKGMVTKFH